MDVRETAQLRCWKREERKTNEAGDLRESMPRWERSRRQGRGVRGRKGRRKADRMEML